MLVGLMLLLREPWPLRHWRELLRLGLLALMVMGVVTSGLASTLYRQQLICRKCARHFCVCHCR